MKKLYIALIALLVASGVLAQTTQPCSTCLPNGILFTSQTQIDNFQSNYPNCTEIQGRVIIWGGNITNLNGLSVLTSIGGYLMIGYNTVLTTLTGLDNLTSIGGYLKIVENNALTNLTALDNVISIGGFLEIYDNPVLTSLTGLDNLTYIDSVLYIGNNSALTSLTGLENLTAVGDYLSIYDNDALISLTGLENLTSVDSVIYIGYNSALTSLTGLDNLTSIGSSLYIDDNDALTNLTGLDNINAGTIKYLWISENASLSDCAAQSICDYLAAPNGIVDIYDNATGCNNPTEIADNCGIALPCLPYGNYHFLNQSEIDNFQVNFPNCTDLMGNVWIRGDDINNLEGLNVVTSVDGSLVIADSLDLTTLTGLDNLTSIGGDLSIGINPALTSLTGLDNLTSIGGYLGISGNASLTSLTGMEGLTSIGGYLSIENNDALTSLTGLDNVVASSITDLYILNNVILSTCAIQSICDYLAAPNGTVSIYNNSTGCNSQAQVEDACVYLSTGELNLHPALSLYPNPASTIITISTPTIPNKNTFMTLYNLNGQALLSRQITEPIINVDVSGLVSGVYFVKLTDERTVNVGKFVME